MRLLGALLLIAAVACRTEAAASLQSPVQPFTPTAFSVEVHGSGRPVILIPGLGCPGAVWNDITERLAGYQTHTLTLAGFAGRPRIDEPLSATTRDELARYIRAHGLDRPVVIGHSMGGYIAYWLAATEPELVGPTVVVDAGPAFGPDDRAAIETAAAQARDAWSRASDDEFARQVQDVFSSMSVRPARLRSTIAAVARSDRRAIGDAVYEMVTHDLRPQLRHIRAPVLVVLADGGLQDQYRAQAGAVPDHQVVVLPRTGHFVFVDDPEAFVTTVARFLESRATVAAR